MLHKATSPLQMSRGIKLSGVFSGARYACGHFDELLICFIGVKPRPALCGVILRWPVVGLLLFSSACLVFIHFKVVRGRHFVLHKTRTFLHTVWLIFYTLILNIFFFYCFK